MQLPYRGSGGPLHLLVDSTGIKVRGEGEWHARKHGGAKRRVWRKVHLAINEATLEVRAVEFTDSTVGDAPMQPGLLSQISGNEPIASVTADVPTMAAPAGTPSPCEAPRRSSRRAGTPSPGRRTAPGRQQGTKPCAP